FVALQALVVDAELVFAQNVSERFVLRFFSRSQIAENFLTCVANRNAHRARLSYRHFPFLSFYHRGSSQPFRQCFVYFLDARLAVLERLLSVLLWVKAIVGLPTYPDGSFANGIVEILGDFLGHYQGCCRQRHAEHCG